MRGDTTEPEADLQTNLNALRTEVQPQGVDKVLLDFIGHNADRSHQVPDYTTVYTHFLHLGNMSARIRLNEVQLNAPTFWNAAMFRAELDRYKELVQGDVLGIMLQQATDILASGYTPPPVGGKPSPRLVGPGDAVKFIEGGLAALQARFFSGEIEGSFKLDAASVFAQYQARKGKFEPGVLSGFHDLDKIHDGLMPGDLALVLGFTGQYKSTFCLNWAYHAAVYYGKNVAVIPLEMTAKTLLGMLAVMHCHHRVWEDKYGLIDLHYDRFRRGELQQREEELLQVALEDLQGNTEYGQILYKEPHGITTVNDIFRWADQQDRKTPLDLIVIDYLGQVNPSTGGSSLKEASHLNAAIAETKQRAMTFRNKGIAVLSPFQSSREGFKEAEKLGGAYTLRALSWANEAERSSDFVYSVYMDNESRANQRLKVGNLKARDRELITGLHEVFCNPKTRVIDHYDGKRYIMHAIPSAVQQMKQPKKKKKKKTSTPPPPVTGVSPP